MADRKSYPQIPTTVWWGVRAALQRSPNATIDARYLSVQLGVQPAAARAYVAELQAVGILNDECKATPLASRWRLDASYEAAVSELMEKAYPEGLRDLVPPGEADRAKIVTWFMHEGLGQGAAGNKAATYMLLGSPNPNDAPAKAGKATPRGDEAVPASPARSSRKTADKRKVSASKDHEIDEGRQRRGAPETMPLNINVQIHIGADASSDQIENIFSAMKRYLYDAPAA